MKRFAIAAVALMLSACGIKPAVENRLSLVFYEDPSRVHVNTSIHIDDPDNKVIAQRVDALRDAIAGNRDEWAMRFAGLNIDNERIILDRTNGRVTGVERLTTIDRNELPKFFNDMAITVSLLPNNGYTELTIIPGTSSRATRQQRERVLATLHAWSGEAAAYVDALSHLYEYLDANPESAQAVFTILLADHDQKSVNDEEQALIEKVWTTVDRLSERMRPKDTDAYVVDEEFDLVFNPFPGEIVVVTPKTASGVENFDKRDPTTFVIPRRGLLDAVSSLDGKWVSPDPFAMSTHPKPDQLAKMPRHWSAVVTASEIESAVSERLKPASVYRVRWVE
ncbi:MAG TPA: hypothetical protein VHU41_00505 [Thermoanaerobaculia bacterium]|nr:hypothetical protein [Thermoanaerobaculia bacterium]